MTATLEAQGGGSIEAASAWWIFLLWGILSIVIGLLLLLRPGITALIWVQIMAIFWLVGGVFDAIGAVANRNRGWGWQLVAAIISIIAGIVILGSPVLGTVIAVQFLFFIIVFSAIVNGIVNVINAFRLRADAPGSWFWGTLLLGAFQTIIGIWLLLQPLVGMLALLPIFGIFAIAGGIMAIFFAFQVRRMGNVASSAPGTT